MSALLMGRVWELDLPDHQQRLLLCLADHAQDDGSNVFPSRARIAYKMGWTNVRHVSRALRDLEKVGVLVKVTDAHRYRPTEYRIEIANASRKPPIHDPESGVTSTSSLNGRGDIGNPPGVTSGATRGDIAMSPRTIKEPSGNHQHMEALSLQLSDKPRPKPTPKAALEVFNEVFGTRFTSPSYHGPIKRALKENPQLALDDLRAIMENQKGDPWWDELQPNVIFSSKAWPRTLARWEQHSNGNRNGKPKGFTGVSGKVHRTEMAALYADDHPDA